VAAVRINADSLKRWREQAGYTQASLSRATGISQGHISDLEAGKDKTNVLPTTAKRLAEAISAGLTSPAKCRISDITLPDEDEEVAS
jgi:transcriptional regulator with XRE-family HTH domain